LATEQMRHADAELNELRMEHNEEEASLHNSVQAAIFSSTKHTVSLVLRSFHLMKLRKLGGCFFYWL
jgi:hypothetical protein